MSTSSVYAAPGEEQVADKSVANIAFESRNTAKARNQAKTQFRKGEAGHFVGDDDVAGERQLEAAAKANAVDRGNSHEWRHIDPREHIVYALQKFPDASDALLLWKGLSGTVQLQKIGAGREPMLLRAGDDASRGIGWHTLNGVCELLQIGQHGCADFVGRRP